VQLPVLRGN
jgi:adiponectin receptor